jgi:hypothetical protein
MGRPTPKQTAFFRLLATHSVFREWEQARLLTWLAREANRENITPQIDRLRSTIRERMHDAVGEPI